MAKSGKVAIVTGSATGLGASCAIDLAERGWNVAINYTKSKKEADETYEAVKKKGVEAIAARLANVEVVIARRVGETDALYGSVTSADIAEVLAAKGFDIDKRKLQLPEPLKRIGDVDVPVKLHRDVTVTVKVRVVAEAT